MKRHAQEPAPLVLTIGHSTRKLDAFLRLLQAYEVSRLVDVRTITRSRHNPQYNKDDLHKTLAEAKIRYQHLPGLGGLRHARADSPNQGWRNASFRGFADYMQTPKFQTSLGRLLDLLEKDRVVLMCAEAVPWRCHRSLIADALLVRGIQVEHIMSACRTHTHALTPWAKVRGNRIIYPPPIKRANPIKESARGGNIK
jgi:uncharacterized protein (DUF488 family)